MLLLTHQSGDCSLNHTLFIHVHDLGDDDDEDDDDDDDDDDEFFKDCFDDDDGYVANHQIVNLFQASSI